MVGRLDLRFPLPGQIELVEPRSQRVEFVLRDVEVWDVTVPPAEPRELIGVRVALEERRPDETRCEPLLGLAADGQGAIAEGAVTRCAALAVVIVVGSVGELRDVCLEVHPELPWQLVDRRVHPLAAGVDRDARPLGPAV